MTLPKHLMQLMMFVFAAVTVNAKGRQKQCLPLKAQFIFDMYGFQMSYYQLKRFINDIVNMLPGETRIQVITVNSTYIDKFKFTRKNVNGTWLERIGKHDTSSHGIINYMTIKDEIIKFFQKEPNPKTLESIYLLVNEKTKIDDVKKVKEAMKHQIVQIVLYGRHTEGDIWTELSEHIYVLDDDMRKIKPTVQSVMRLSCNSNHTSETTPDLPRQDKNPSEDHFQILPIINAIALFCLSIFVLRGKLFWVWNRLRIWYSEMLPVPAQDEETEMRMMTEQKAAVRDQIFVELKQIAQTKIQTEIEKHAKYMKTLCEDMQRKIEDLQSKNQISNKEMQRMNDENKRLKNGIVECKESVEKLCKQNEIIQRKIEDIEAENKTSNNKIKRMDNQTKILKMEIDEHAESITKLHKQVVFQLLKNFKEDQDSKIGFILTTRFPHSKETVTATATIQG